MIIDLFFRHGWTQLLKKTRLGCAMGKGFICIKAILKYRHGSFPQSKLSRELAKQAVITKCRGLSMREPSRVFIKIKPWISVPKRKSVIIKISLIFKNLCKSVIICGQKTQWN